MDEVEQRKYSVCHETDGRGTLLYHRYEPFSLWFFVSSVPVQFFSRVERCTGVTDRTVLTISTTVRVFS
jgi:hypothetical protein